MSSGMYSQHRGIPPGPAPIPQPQNQARLNDAFDTIRTEFDALTSEVVSLRKQREELEQGLNVQVSELDLIRRSVYELETQHGKIRQQYEDDIARLRQDLQLARQGLSSVAPPSAPSGPGLQHSATGPGAGSLPPYGPGDGFYGRGGRDEPRRSREDRDRVMDRERDRDRDERERDRDRRDRDRDREMDRKMKTERIKTDRGDPYSPSMSAGPSNGRLPQTGPGLPPPATPTNGDYPMGDATSFVRGGPPSSIPDTDYTEEFDPATAPPERKKDGGDWWAVWSSKSKRVLDVNLVHTLTHDTVVCCVRFSADGKYLATGANRVAQIFDVKTGAKTCMLVDENTSKDGDLYIRTVCFSPDGRFLATGAEDTRIRIWDIKQKRIAKVFDGHSQDIYSLQFSKDGRFIVSGSGDRTARIWDMSCEPNTPGSIQRILPIDEPEVDAGITSVAISPDNRFVAAGSLDTVVRIWDAHTGELLEKLRGHRDSVYSVTFTIDGKGLISSSLDKTLKYWDIRSMTGRGRKDDDKRPIQSTMNFISHKDFVLSVAASNDGNWIVSGSKDRGVCFWDARTAQPQLMLQGHKNSVISIDLNPMGGILASGSGDCLARIWSYTAA